MEYEDDGLDELAGRKRCRDDDEEEVDDRDKKRVEPASGGDVDVTIDQHCQICGTLFDSAWFGFGLQPGLGCFRCRFMDIVHGRYEKKPNNHYISMVQRSITERGMDPIARYEYMTQLH